MSDLSVFERIAGAASLLEDRDVIELVSSVRRQWGAPRLRILVVGSTGAGRFSLVNVLLRQPRLLPTSPIPRAPLSVSLHYGVSQTVEGISAGGERTAFPAARLKALLTEPPARPVAQRAPVSCAPPEMDRYEEISVETTSELLKTSDLRIEALEVERPAGSWKQILAATDYVLLVLNAAALLSNQEREFIRTVLEPNVGLQRVAIVVNQMDRVPAEEQSSILDLVHGFLGPLEGHAPVIPFAAARAHQANGKQEGAEAGNYRALMDLVYGDLSEQHQVLREAAMEQATEICLTALEQAAERARALLSLDEESLCALKERIDSRQQWLETRIARAHRRIQAFVDTLIKEQFLRAIDGFGEVFAHRLPEEIESVEDVHAIKRHLPGYIQAVWREFLDTQAVAVQSKLLDEAAALDAMIELDLREWVEGAAAGQGEPAGFSAAAIPIHTFIMPRRGGNPAAGISKGLSLAGLFLVFWNLPLSLGLLGTGLVIRTIFKQGIDESDKEAIFAAARSATLDLQRQIQREVEEQFTQLTRDMESAVARAYAQGTAGVEAFLAEGLARYHAMDTKRQEIEKVLTETIPALRRAAEPVA